MMTAIIAVFCFALWGLWKVACIEFTWLFEGASESEMLPPISLPLLDHPGKSRGEGDNDGLRRRNLLSIITPVYNEGKQVERFLLLLQGRCSDVGEIEVVLVDGGSTDSTADIVVAAAKKASLKFQFAVSEGGRGSALVMGANLARGSFLMFLHCDCSEFGHTPNGNFRLTLTFANHNERMHDPLYEYLNSVRHLCLRSLTPPLTMHILSSDLYCNFPTPAVPPQGFDATVKSALSYSSVLMTCFRLGFDLDTSDGKSPPWGLELVKIAVRHRTDNLKFPYGDQALALRTESYEGLGGFLPMPIFEDFDFVRRAKGACIGGSGEIVQLEEVNLLLDPKAT